MLATILDTAARAAHLASAELVVAACHVHERVNRATTRMRQLAAFMRDPWWSSIPTSSAVSSPPGGPNSRAAESSKEPRTFIPCDCTFCVGNGVTRNG